MKNAQRIELIKQISLKSEEKAAAVLGECNTRLYAMERQLQKLYQYRDEYNQQFTQAGNQHIKSNTLQDYMRFINNINHNIDKVLEGIDKQKAECEKLKQNWLEKHQKVDIYSKVQDKLIHSEQQQLNKKEQKLNDESSIGFFLRNRR